MREVESAHPVPRLAGAPVAAAAAPAGARPRRARVQRHAGSCSPRRRGRGSPATSRRTSRALLASGATVDGVAAAARRRRGAGAHERPGRGDAGRPRGRRRARGALGHHERVRHTCGPGVADAAARAGAAAADPDPRRSPDLLPRPVRRGVVRGRRTRDAADALLDELGATLRRWAAVLHGKGVAALLEAVTTGTGLPGRLLGAADGERRLTDLRHVGQALHAAAVDAHLGPRALVEWLRAPHRRGRGGRRARAQQAAGLGRRRGAGHHRAPQQGAGVPGRVRAVRLGPLRAPRARRAPAARRRGRARARRRRGGRAALVRALCAPRGGRGGRRPPAALRGADPGTAARW